MNERHEIREPFEINNTYKISTKKLSDQNTELILLY